VAQNPAVGQMAPNAAAGGRAIAGGISTIIQRLNDPAQVDAFIEGELQAASLSGATPELQCVKIFFCFFALRFISFRTATTFRQQFNSSLNTIHATLVSLFHF